MKFSARTLMLAGLLALAVPAGAGPMEDFAAATARFGAAAGGDTGATDDAVARLDRLAEAEPADAPHRPLILAYLGAAQTLQGRDAWMPWTKMRATERGLATLDKALRRLEPRHESARFRDAPVALETRLVAASTFIAVPGLFNRFDEGKAVLRAALGSPVFAAAPAPLRADLHRQAAIAAARDKKDGEEAAQWRLAIAAAPTGEIAAAGRKRLQELGQ
ncbi:MAG: hypothetical protein Q8O34_14070 [Rhodocyclaceae bacterium]|nr:hypothetical protein [Rhodocyclaceae bacterium]